MGDAAAAVAGVGDDDSVSLVAAVGVSEVTAAVGLCCLALTPMGFLIEGCFFLGELDVEEGVEGAATGRVTEEDLDDSL